MEGNECYMEGVYVCVCVHWFIRVPGNGSLGMEGNEYDVGGLFWRLAWLARGCECVCVWIEVEGRGCKRMHVHMQVCVCACVWVCVCVCACV